MSIEIRFRGGPLDGMQRVEDEMPPDRWDVPIPLRPTLADIADPTRPLPLPVMRYRRARGWVISEHGVTRMAVYDYEGEFGDG